MEQNLLSEVREIVAAADAKLGRRISKFIQGCDAAYHQRAEDFFQRYRAFMEAQGRSFSFGVECFLRLHHSIGPLTEAFIQSGRYANTSFEEVNRSVYANPEAMEYHMHGLVLAQFLWPDQYQRFRFFCENLGAYSGSVKKYLEVGGGHGLYLLEGARQLPQAEIHAVDISETSLALARGIAGGEPAIRYHLMNIFDFPDAEFDFVTMGEVLEHVEEPRELLGKVRRLLAHGGHAYITTPANAPMPDHIYLFNNAQEIRTMLTECGFRIERETAQCADAGISEEDAERMKLPLMYAAFVSVG